MRDINKDNSGINILAKTNNALSTSASSCYFSFPSSGLNRIRSFGFKVPVVFMVISQFAFTKQLLSSILGREETMMGNGVNPSSTNAVVVDYQNQTCTSPERDVSFPLEGDIVISHTVSNNYTTRSTSMSSSRSFSCGLNAKNPFSEYLKETLHSQQLPPLLQDCSTLVVFGVAFGNQFVQLVNQSIHKNPQRSQRLMDHHGKCFFLFVSQDDMPSNINHPVQQGHLWFTPIPKWVFPYRNAHRNGKIMKFMGHLLFPNVETIIWQDAKFFSKSNEINQPDNYWNVVREENNACLTTYGLPISRAVLGDHPAVTSGCDYCMPKDKFQAHCNTIVETMVRRPNVTDSVDSVKQQCKAYYDQIADMGNDTNALEALNWNMIDGAFMIWNHGTEECRLFGNAFRCAVLEQCHCHSDRDQISFPFVLSTQFGRRDQTDYFYEKEEGSTKENQTNPAVNLKPLDDDWNPAMNDLLLVRRKIHSGDSNHTNFSNTSLVRIVRQSCHWYHKQLGSSPCNLS